MNVHYATLNGERSGRVSHFYKSAGQTHQQLKIRNDKAVELGVRFVYDIASCDESEVSDKKSIR